MLRQLVMAAPAAALLLSGCSTEGGGALGFVAFDKNHQVAAAEPLFGKDEDKCLDRPGFLISLFSDGPPPPPADPMTSPHGRRGGRGPALQAVCDWLRGEIKAALAAGHLGHPAAMPLSRGPAYSDRQRNEVMDALIAASNRKCGRYIAYLQTWDANINSTFGIASLATAGLATVVGGESTAKALAGMSGFFSGTRSTFNEAHFRNRTIAVLATAFENARREQREEITNRQQCPADKYTLMRGMEDSFRYHATCSVVAGLDEASRAVQRSSAPDLETMKKIIADAMEIRRQLAAVSEPPGSAPATGQGQGDGGEPKAGQGGNEESGNPAGGRNGGAATATNPFANGSQPGEASADTGRRAGADPSNLPHCPFAAHTDAKPNASGQDRGAAVDRGS